ncbi:MAG: hypothetical protein FWH32_06830 [Clostridiales bacterium]|nr:hypothetical protein [Clostridiales bacterium]
MNDIVGCKVTHHSKVAGVNEYGEGNIVSFAHEAYSAYIKVKFHNKQEPKTFTYPDSFLSGTLSTDEPAILENLDVKRKVEETSWETVIEKAIEVVRSDRDRTGNCRLCTEFSELIQYTTDEVEQAIYTVRYFGAYYQEALDVYTEYLSESLSGKKEITVLSLGCGNCPDFFALREFAKRRSKSYRYVGIDTGEWNVDHIQNLDGFEYHKSWDGFEELKKPHLFDVIMFSKSLRNIGIGNAKDYLKNARLSKSGAMICLDAGNEKKDYGEEEHLNNKLAEHLKEITGMKSDCHHKYYKGDKNSLDEYVRDVVGETYGSYCKNTCGKRPKPEEGKYQKYRHSAVFTKTLYHGSIYFWEKP